MLNIDSLLAEYNESHLNKTNILIHKICVPLIFFSIVGLIIFLGDFIKFNALVYCVMLLALLYYYLLSKKYFLMILPFFFVSLVGNLYLLQINLLLEVSLVIFIVSWIFQFVGHKIEGKKPSFLKDLQFLLIGPLWTLKTLFNLERIYAASE